MPVIHMFNVNELIQECFTICHHVLRFFIKCNFCAGVYSGVGHYGGNRMTVSCFHWRMWLAPAANAFHPVSDMGRSQAVSPGIGRCNDFLCICLLYTSP